MLFERCQLTLAQYHMYNLYFVTSTKDHTALPSVKQVTFIQNIQSLYFTDYMPLTSPPNLK